MRRSDAPFQCARYDARLPFLTRQRLECADVFLCPGPHLRRLLRHLCSPCTTIADPSAPYPLITRVRVSHFVFTLSRCNHTVAPSARASKCGGTWPSGLGSIGTGLPDQPNVKGFTLELSKVGYQHDPGQPNTYD